MSEDVKRQLTLPEKIQIRCFYYTRFMSWFGLVLMLVAAMFPNENGPQASILQPAQISCLMLYAFFLTYWIVEWSTNVSVGVNIKEVRKKHKAFLLMSTPVIIGYRIAVYILEHRYPS